MIKNLFYLLLCISATATTYGQRIFIPPSSTPTAVGYDTTGIGTVASANIQDFFPNENKLWGAIVYNASGVSINSTLVILENSSTVINYDLADTLNFQDIIIRNNTTNIANEFIVSIVYQKYDYNNLLWNVYARHITFDKNSYTITNDFTTLLGPGQFAKIDAFVDPSQYTFLGNKPTHLVYDYAITWVDGTPVAGSEYRDVHVHKYKSDNTLDQSYFFSSWGITPDITCINEYDAVSGSFKEMIYIITSRTHFIASSGVATIARRSIMQINHTDNVIDNTFGIDMTGAESFGHDRMDGFSIIDDPLCMNKLAYVGSNQVSPFYAPYLPYIRRELVIGDNLIMASGGIVDNYQAWITSDTILGGSFIHSTTTGLADNLDSIIACTHFNFLRGTARISGSIYQKGILSLHALDKDISLLVVNSGSGNEHYYNANNTLIELRLVPSTSIIPITAPPPFNIQELIAASHLYKASISSAPNWGDNLLITWVDARNLYYKYTGDDYENNLLRHEVQIPVFDLNVYPNPVSNNEKLNYTSPKQIKSIRLYNAAGSINEGIDNINHFTGNISVSHLSAGIYFVEFISKDNERFVTKFIKK